MYKTVFLINKKPGIDHEEFKRYWSESHSPIGASLPGLRKYVQNHTLPGSDGTQPAFDGFAELWFDDAEALATAMESPEGQAAMADVANFADVEKMLAFDVDELAIL